MRDGGWGSQVQGEWGGMVGELVRGEADIAVAALDITHKRSTAVDFLLGFLYSKYACGYIYLLLSIINLIRAWIELFVG